MLFRLSGPSVSYRRRRRGCFCWAAASRDLCKHVLQHQGAGRRRAGAISIELLQAGRGSSQGVPSRLLAARLLLQQHLQQQDLKEIKRLYGLLEWSSWKISNVTPSLKRYSLLLQHPQNKMLKNLKYLEWWEEFTQFSQWPMYHRAGVSSLFCPMNDDNAHNQGNARAVQSRSCKIVYLSRQNAVEKVICAGSVGCLVWQGVF